MIEKELKFRFLKNSILALFLLFVFAQSCASNSDDEPLIIYSGRTESLIGPVLKQFETLSGVPIEVKYGNTGALAAQLLEEGSKTPADIFFTQDPGGLGVVESMLGTIPFEIMEPVPDWAKSPVGAWVGISGRARVLVYNSTTISESDLPNSILDLTDPKWKGRLSWAPSNSSFQAMVTGMRIVWGERKTRDWLVGIMKNEPLLYPRNTPQVTAVAAGEIDIGMVNHYYLHRFLAEDGDGFPARNWFTPAVDPGSMVLTAAVGILKDSNNRENAERFIKFLLSEVAQQYFATQTFEYPLIEGVKTDRGLPPIESLSKPNIDLFKLGDLEKTQDLLRDIGALS